MSSFVPVLVRPGYHGWEPHRELEADVRQSCTMAGRASVTCYLPGGGRYGVINLRWLELTAEGAVLFAELLLNPPDVPYLVDTW